MRAYSSCERPCAATIWGVMAAMGRAPYQTGRIAVRPPIARKGCKNFAGAFRSAAMAQVEGDRESRLAEAERRQRILSEVSRVLLDYVGPDEIGPLRRL